MGEIEGRNESKNVSDAYTAQFKLWAELSGVGSFARTTDRTEQEQGASTSESD